MKILLTGGAGFIGSNIADTLIENGHQVAIVDNLVTGHVENLNPDAVFYEMDINNLEIDNIFSVEKPDIVIHHAAQVSVQKSIGAPIFDAKSNIMATINILDNCVKHKVKKIIYASSAALYGVPQYLPIDERHKIDPISFYGISKYVPEKYIKVYSDLYGLKYTIFRYSNVYGIRQSIEGEGGVISIFTGKLINGDAPMIFGDGENTRDYINVFDIANANHRALTKGDNEIFNISTNTRVSLNELYSVMKGIANYKGNAIYAPERKGDIMHSSLDNTKAKNVLGWEPVVTLEKGLRNTINYYMKKESQV